MNITYLTVEPQPAAVKEIVIINGQECGTVTPWESQYMREKFYCQMRIDTSTVSAPVHIGGFGVTKEDAIQEAINNAKALQTELAAWIEKVA